VAPRSGSCDALLRAHFEGAVPLDQLRTEQDRISTALANAQHEVAERQLTRDQLHNALDGALNLLHDSHSLSLSGQSRRERRGMNQAVFPRLYIYDDAVDAHLTDLFDRLLAPDLKELLGAQRARQPP
jgi:site-specific DNA recombinase